VDEILAAGIDVYTTLNVQHLESLNDAVAQITGVTVGETIPDQVIDQGTDLELIDLPPDELQQRMKEGKVQIPEQAAPAMGQFFRKGNLPALRELAMRYAATRVDEQMQAYMQMRSARRLAGELNAEWTALDVETPDHLRLDPEAQDRVARSLYLAEELGGRAITLPGRSVAAAAVDYARRHNVTKAATWPVGEPVFEVGDLKMDLGRRLVTISGDEVALTPTEYDLLRLLVQHAGKVLTTTNCCARCGAVLTRPRSTCCR